MGEWYDKESLVDGVMKYHGAPTKEQISAASKNCFAVGGIYIGWTVFAAFCVVYQRSKAKAKLN